MEYVKCGDYYVPNLKIGIAPRPIGRWGRMRRDYLREHHPVIYNTEVLSATLWKHLADLDRQAADRLDRIIAQMKSQERITEELKQVDSMCWVQKMNSIRARAEEIIIHELIYTEETI